MRKLYFTAVGLALLAAPSIMATDSALIINSGSTNTAGFRIEVSQSGDATYTPAARRGGQLPEAQNKPATRQVPSAAVKKFFADIEAAKPLTSLPRGACMKSASFGTTLVVQYEGQTTPDLSCGDHENAKLKALIQSSQDIVKLFNGQ